LGSCRLAERGATAGAVSEKFRSSDAMRRRFVLRRLSSTAFEPLARV
jgi:hypothetical protein